jgi:hypothetical protein
VVVAGSVVVGWVVVGWVVVGSVVVGWVVVGSALVVGSSVVVGSTVLVGVVVLDSMVVVGAVTVGSVVVAPDVDGAPVVVVRPTLAGTPVVVGRAVVAGPLAATRAVSGLLVDGAREVLGSRARVVVVDADVDVGSAGNVDSAAPPGGRPGVGGAGLWGTRAAEATRAASTDAVSPKATSMSLQGNRSGSRCRGGGLGMAAVVPVRLILRGMGCPPSHAITGRKGRNPAEQIERRVRAPWMRTGDAGAAGGEAGCRPTGSAAVRTGWAGRPGGWRRPGR